MLARGTTRTGEDDGIDVLVVDQHEIVCEGLGLLLSSQPGVRVVATARSAADAIDRVGRHEPDVVLIDDALPDLNAPDTTRSILALPAARHPRVIVVAASERDEDVHDALRAGASGFLSKCAARAELAMAVRSVAGGDAYLAPPITRRLIDNFAQQRSTAVLRNVVASLTARENQVLKLLAGGHSNGEIAAALVLAEQTVKSHVSSIFAKIGVRDRAQAVVFSYENALVAVESKA